MIGTGSAMACFGLEEVGQDVLIRPALAAEIAPGIEVGRGAARVDHAVDRTAATQNLRLNERKRAVVHLLLGLGHVTPAELRVEGDAEDQSWNAQQHRAVGQARFEQQHTHIRVLGQAGGENAPARAAAHDDVIEGFVRHARAASRRSSSCASK
jgi:hypothetical protein